MSKQLSILVGILVVGSLLLVACAPAAPPPTPTPAAAAKAAAPAAAPTATVKPAATLAPPTPTPKPEKLKLATPTTGLVELAEQIATKQGYFAQENLEIEITPIRSDVSVKALVAGELDFILSLGTTLRAASTGVPVKAVLAAIAKPYHVLVVRPEIKEGKDLVGKVFGVDSIGGTTEYLARVAVEHYGLNPDKDITVVAMGGNPERMAALKGGAIHATQLESLYANKAANEGMKLLLKMADVIDMPVAGLGATDKMIKERPDLVLRVVRATVKGLRYVKDPKNKDNVINFLADQFKVSKDEAAATYPDIIRSFSDDGFASEESVMRDVRLAIERAGANPNTKLSDVFDYTFVKKVKEGG